MLSHVEDLYLLQVALTEFQQFDQWPVPRVVGEGREGRRHAT